MKRNIWRNGKPKKIDEAATATICVDEPFWLRHGVSVKRRMGHNNAETESYLDGQDL